MAKIYVYEVIPARAKDDSWFEIQDGMGIHSYGNTDDLVAGIHRLAEATDTLLIKFDPPGDMRIDSQGTYRLSPLEDGVQTKIFLRHLPTT